MNFYFLKNLQFTIFRPGGNDTGLFSGIISDSKQRQKIAAKLQKQYANVEQVGFVHLDKKNPELMMAGGEFCGNATNSAVYLILNGKPGEIMIKVSGAQNKLKAGVTSNGEAYSQVPITKAFPRVQFDSKNPENAIVEMEGIAHYIDFDVKKIKGLSIDEIKTKARKEMARRGLDRELCCGIIYTEKIKSKLVIHPVVYVRDVDTLFYETACGSGVAALGMVLALKQGKSIKELPVVQPSGMIIKTSITYDGRKFGYSQIQSQVKKLQKGVLTTLAFPVKTTIGNLFSYFFSKRIRVKAHQKLVPAFLRR